MKTIRHENRLWVLADDHLKALDFAREAAKAVERDECAKVCEGINSTKDYYGERVELVCAEAIRARGQS
jgi:hypothetical protein